MLQMSVMLLVSVAPQSMRAKSDHTRRLLSTSLNAPLTKASHMAMLSINRAGKNLPIVVHGKEHE